jgi:mRNA-degrading endonuclease toxin of MazEF toxin-antitoxin module
MACKRSDVVAVSFPFLEGTDAKRRPALIVSTERLEKEQSLYWIAMITTAKSGSRRDDISVTDLMRGASGSVRHPHGAAGDGERRASHPPPWRHHAEGPQRRAASHAALRRVMGNIAAVAG